jgi:hypothetical protein
MTITIVLYGTFMWTHQPHGMKPAVLCKMSIRIIYIKQVTGPTSYTECIRRDLEQRYLLLFYIEQLSGSTGHTARIRQRFEAMSAII